MVPSFEKRVRAFAIDTSGVTLLLILSIPLGADIAKYVAIAAVFIFYFFPYLLSNGQSFGKRTQKIKIVSVDGSNAPLWRILLREIFKISLSVVTGGLYMVIAFFVLSDKKSQTIHDYIFKTKLIDLRPETERYNNNVLGKTESMKKRGF